MSIHTGETEALYSRKVARLATKIIGRLGVAENEKMCEAVFGIARLAEADPNHALTLGVIRGKLEAFGVPEETMRSLIASLEAMDDIVRFIHPTVEDSRYLYRFLGFPD